VCHLKIAGRVLATGSLEPLLGKDEWWGVRVGGGGSLRGQSKPSLATYGAAYLHVAMKALNVDYRVLGDTRATLQAPGGLQAWMVATRQLPKGHSFSIGRIVASRASLVVQVTLLKGHSL